MNPLLKTFLFTAGLLAFTSIQAAPELKGTPDELKRFLHPDVKTISISGAGEETAYSDQAHVTLVVSTTEKTLTQSLEKNSAIRKALADSFMEAGIAPARINNAQFSSSPQYGWFGKKPTEYEVVNRLKVTIEGEAQLTLLAKAADQKDEVSVGTIEFEHSQKKVFEKKVRDAALDEAMVKSSDYATKLGLVLTPVSFRFHNMKPMRPQSSMMMEEVVVTARRKGKSMQSAPIAPPAPPVTFDEVEYRSRVDVVFEIASKQNP